MFVMKGGVVYKTSTPKGEPKEAKYEVVCTEYLHSSIQAAIGGFDHAENKDLSHAQVSHV